MGWEEEEEAKEGKVEENRKNRTGFLCFRVNATTDSSFILAMIAAYTAVSSRHYPHIILVRGNAVVGPSYVFALYTHAA